jgi:hypothetical protein
MGHGNSNKLYVTHAEHSGLFGQHTASTAGYKAYGTKLICFHVPTHYTLPERPKHLRQEREPRLTAVPSVFSHGHILFALETKTGRDTSLIS